MKSSIITLVAAATFLCLVAFPTTTVGTWPKPIQGWPHPSKISRNEMFMSTSYNNFNFGDSKVWKCTYSNGSDPAISISNPSPPSTPSTPSPSTPPPTPKTSPPPPTPSTPPPTPKTSPPPPTPKISPPPPTPSPPPPAPKMSPPPSTPSPTPKRSHPQPSPPPPEVSEQPFNPNPNPPSEHHHSHNHHHQHEHENGWEHFLRCMRNMGPVGTCRRQMSISYYKRMFGVSDYCCNLLVNMNNECDDVAWGFFTDPYFLPLLRCTCHVNL